MINKLKSDWACGPHPHFQEDGRQETISTRQVLLCVQQGTRAEVYMGTHMLRCLSISFSYRNIHSLGVGGGIWKIQRRRSQGRHGVLT